MQAVLPIPYMPHLHVCEGGRPSAPLLASGERPSPDHSLRDELQGHGPLHTLNPSPIDQSKLPAPRRSLLSSLQARVTAPQQGLSGSGCPCTHLQAAVGGWLGGSELAWPACARWDGPAWHSLVRGLQTCVFSHSDCFSMYGLLMDSFTGKLKIPLNA